MACAALLHDAVEDHAPDIAPSGRQAALAVLAGRYGDRTADLVAAVTNPAWEPGRDKHEQYREHVLASLAASPWARVIKASDFTDNAVGIIHTTGPKLSKLARKYSPLVPALRELILRPDTPLDADIKTMIAAQLDAAQGRFAAIWHGHDHDSGASHPPPSPAPRSSHPGACHRETADRARQANANGRPDRGRSVVGSGRPAPR